MMNDEFFNVDLLMLTLFSVEIFDSKRVKSTSKGQHLVIHHSSFHIIHHFF